MKNRSTRFLLSTFAFLLCAAVTAHGQLRDYTENAAGLTIAKTPESLLGFHGSAPTAQRAGSAQAALTDSTSGTAATTTAAGTGVHTISIPIQLSAMTTSAADLITAYVPGYKFKILKADFATTKLGTGSGASQVVNLAIGSTAVTGGVVTLTLGGTDTLGKLSAGTAVTAANTGTATDTISVKVAASGTVFTAGDGVLLVKIQNMDTADSHASELRLLNELRAAMVEKGEIKGAP